MKLADIIKEAPLPDDWEKSTYKKEVPFAKRIRYAKSKAQQVGAGSSRVAFIIDYQGRKTVLKIAKNKKGIAQNEYESQILGDYYVEDLNITIPMIDYDEENDQPTWIHTEFAEKMKPTQFKKFFSGISHDQIEYVLKLLTGKLDNNLRPEEEEKYQQIYEDNEYLDSLVDLAGNYDIPTGDFTRLANWGVYQGRPVIIDMGLSSDVLKQYYRL